MTLDESGIVCYNETNFKERVIFLADLIIAFPIFVVILIFILSATIQFLRSRKSSVNPSVRRSHDGYNREVDEIHITSDAASERQRRLDQLKSLYEAGMMGKEEYWERRESVEADYRGENRY